MATSGGLGYIDPAISVIASTAVHIASQPDLPQRRVPARVEVCMANFHQRKFNGLPYGHGPP